MTVISLRLSPDEIDTLKAAAAADKLKLGTWIKRAALIEADRTKSPQLPPIPQQPATTTPQSLQ